MKVISLLFFISTAIFCTNVNAQKIDNGSIQQLQNQRSVQFLGGEITIIMHDTTSPGFFISEFSNRGYEITYADSTRLTARVVIKKEHPDLERLLSHPKLYGFDDLENKFSPDNITILPESEEPVAKLLEEKRALTNTSIILFLTFEYGVNETTFDKIRNDFPDFTYEFISSPRRTVNLKTEIGKELDAIDKLSQLPFVETSAMIGIIGSSE